MDKRGEVHGVDFHPVWFLAMLWSLSSYDNWELIVLETVTREHLHSPVRAGTERAFMHAFMHACMNAGNSIVQVAATAASALPHDRISCPVTHNVAAASSHDEADHSNAARAHATNALDE